MGRWMVALLIIFAWATGVSFPTLDRPLDLRHDWLTAHTAINLEYMHQCGPRGLAASILFLPNAEMDCESPFRMEDPGKRIYLSYPTGWLLALLPPYSLARTWLPDNIPIYLIVRCIALVLIRLPLIALFLWWMYLALKWSLPYLTEMSLFYLSSASCLFLFSSPSFLHYTQNAIFTDMAVLVPIYLSAFALTRIQQQQRLHIASGLLLFSSMWLSASTDWYGTIWVFFSMVFILLHWKSKLRVRALTNIASAALLAATHYLLQLLILAPGIDQVLNTASHRTGAGFYFSHFLVNVGLAIRTVTFTMPVSLASAQGLTPFLLLVTSVIGSGLLLFLRRNDRANGWILLGPYLCGLVHLLILSQHSAEHDFAALKFGPALVTLSVVLAVLLIRVSLRFDANRTVPGFAIVFILASLDARNLHLQTAGLAEPSMEHLTMEKITHQVLTPKEIPVTIAPENDNGLAPLEARGWNPPVGLALAEREIYTPRRLRTLAQAMQPEARWHRVTLLSLSANGSCDEKWKRTSLKFRNKPVLLCRTSLTLAQYLDTEKEAD